MKKTLLGFGLIIVLMMTGCASRIDAVPVFVESQEECHSCKEDFVRTCTHEIKVVNYKDRCTNNCSFPVTIRNKSTCRYGGGM